MSPEITKLIEQYLAGELSASDKIIFEERLATNSTLQEEVEFHRELHSAAQRSALRQEVMKASSQYHMMNKFKWGGFGLILAAVLATSVWVVNSKVEKKDIIPLSELKKLTTELKNESPIDGLASEFFSWNGTDTAMLSAQGVLISIPANALLLDGKPYTAQAVIQWQEALDGTTIVKSGLSTLSNDKLLETQGMFSFSAKTPEGKQLTINPNVGVYVQVPVDEYKSGMKLFDGEKDKKGNINWVKPRDLEKIPVPVSMEDLDFYPSGYEPKLNELKARKDKKYRDSLYLSFEEDDNSVVVEEEIPLTESRVAEAKVIYSNIDEEAQFPGGYAAMKDYINENMRYPQIASDNNITGKVYMKFVISEEGEISNVTVTRGLNPLIDNEAVKLIEEMPNWIPAKILGNPVSSWYNLPISFQIDGSATMYVSTGTKINSSNSIDNNDWTDKISWNFTVEHLGNNEANIVGSATVKDGWHVFSVDHDPTKADLTGYPTKFIIPQSENYKTIGTLKDGIKPAIVNDDLGTSLYFNNIASFKQKIKILNPKSFDLNLTYSFQVCDENGCIFPPDQEVSLQVNGTTEKTDVLDDDPGHIPPSSVLAFWQPKFNNTLLATREFETRMKAIHETCNKKVLDVYIDNLNKPMNQLDRRVARMGYTQFESFSEENVGALNPNNPHLKGLKVFYEKAIKDLKTNEKYYREKEEQRRKKWDDKVVKSRNKEEVRTVKREREVFSQEYDLNYKNVSKQFGKTVGAVIYGTSPISNIDKFVRETTIARKTAELYDEQSGKTARIQYNEFSFKVANSGEYQRVFAYLFPDKLNSYHRLEDSKGNFSYSLNNDIIYHLAIVGISEKGYSYSQKMTLKGGDLGEITLERVPEAKLDASIRQLNSLRGVKTANISQEISWLKIEQKNYVEQKKRSDNIKFRDEIRPTVFPCVSGAVPADSIVAIK